MSKTSSSVLTKVLTTSEPLNSAADMIVQSVGFTFDETVHITGVTGTVNLNVFKVTGSVRVLQQWAEITEVTTLTNMTDVYADAWDGTVAVQLTKSPGATLSNAPVGTFFTKDKDSTNTYTVSLADQVRVAEAVNKQSLPFFVTQKIGTDTYIRFNFTTTDSPIDFKMRVLFQWIPVDGGNLELA